MIVGSWPVADGSGLVALGPLLTDTVEKVRTLKESKYFRLVHAFSESERGGPHYMPRLEPGSL